MQSGVIRFYWKCCKRQWSEKKNQFSNTNGEKWHSQCLKAYVFHRNQVRWNVKN